MRTTILSLHASGSCGDRDLNRRLTRRRLYLCNLGVRTEKRVILVFYARVPFSVLSIPIFAIALAGEWVKSRNHRCQRGLEPPSKSGVQRIVSARGVRGSESGTPLSTRSPRNGEARRKAGPPPSHMSRGPSLCLNVHEQKGSVKTLVFSGQASTLCSR
jgi:hypothetical protein